MKFCNVFRLTLRDAQGRAKQQATARNLLVDDGLEYIAERGFLGVIYGNPQLTRLGMVDETGFSALAVGDTLASHAGWQETAAYFKRVAMAPDGDVAVNYVLSMETIELIYFVNPGTIVAVFICTGSQALGSTDGSLLCHALLDTPLTVAADDTIAAGDMVYTIEAVP